IPIQQNVIKLVNIFLKLLFTNIMDCILMTIINHYPALKIMCWQLKDTVVIIKSGYSIEFEFLLFDRIYKSIFIINFYRTVSSIHDKISIPMGTKSPHGSSLSRAFPNCSKTI